MSQTPDATPENASEKNKFRSSYKTQRLPRETKMGLAVIGSLVLVFGWVLYTRLTRPTEFDAEQYVAKNPSAQLGSTPPATSLTPTATMLPGTAQTLPSQSMSGQQYSGAPAATMMLPATQPNHNATQINSAASADPFLARGPAGMQPPQAAATGNHQPMQFQMPTAPAQPLNTGAMQSTTIAVQDQPKEPRDSFMPPADRAESMPSKVTDSQPNQSYALPATTTTASASVMPSNAGEPNPLSMPTQLLQSTTTTAANALNESSQQLRETTTAATQQVQDQAGQLLKSGQNMVQGLNQAGQEANNIYQGGTQAVQDLTKHAGTVTQQGTDYAKQAGAAAQQAGQDLQQQAGQQLNQFTNTLRNTAREQVQQTQQQLQGAATNYANQASNQLRQGIDQSVNNTTNGINSAMQNIASAATTRLAPLTTPATQPAGGFTNPGLTAPRQLDASQAQGQPLAPNFTGSGFTNRTSNEPPVRIPEPSYNQQPAATGTSLQFTQPQGQQPAPSFTQPAGSTMQPAPSFTQPASSATRTSFETPTNQAPAAQSYTVQPNDSYYSVAEKSYGNGNLNKALYEFNQRYNPQAQRLQVGSAMLVPELATLQQLYPDLMPAATTTAAGTANMNR